MRWKRRCAELDYPKDDSLLPARTWKDWIANDSDLDPLRNHPRYGQHIERLKQQFRGRSRLGRDDADCIGVSQKRPTIDGCWSRRMHTSITRISHGILMTSCGAPV